MSYDPSPYKQCSLKSGCNAMRMGIAFAMPDRPLWSNLCTKAHPGCAHRRLFWCTLWLACRQTIQGLLPTDRLGDIADKHHVTPSLMIMHYPFVPAWSSLAVLFPLIPGHFPIKMDKPPGNVILFWSEFFIIIFFRRFCLPKTIHLLTNLMCWQFVSFCFLHWY